MSEIFIEVLQEVNLAYKISTFPSHRDRKFENRYM